MKQEIENHQRFSLRKVKAYKKAGLASVFLGTSLLMANLGNVAHADTNTAANGGEASSVVETDSGSGQDSGQNAQNGANGQALAKTDITQNSQSVEAGVASQKEGASAVQNNAADQTAKLTSMSANETAKAGETSKADQAAGQAEKTAGDLANKDQSVLPIKRENNTADLNVNKVRTNNSGILNKEEKAAIGTDDGSDPDSGVAHVTNPGTTPAKWDSSVPEEGNASYTRSITINYKYGDDTTAKYANQTLPSAADLGYKVNEQKAGQDFRPSDHYSIKVNYHYRYDSATGAIIFSKFNVDKNDTGWIAFTQAMGKDSKGESNVQIYPQAGKTDPVVQDQTVPMVTFRHNIFTGKEGYDGVVTSVQQFDNPNYTGNDSNHKVTLYAVIPQLGDLNDTTGVMIAPTLPNGVSAQIYNGHNGSILNKAETITYYLYERPYRTMYHFMDSTGKEVGNLISNDNHYASENTYQDTLTNQELQQAQGMSDYMLNNVANGQKVDNSSISVKWQWLPDYSLFGGDTTNPAYSDALQSGHDKDATYATNGTGLNNIYLSVVDKTATYKPDGNGGVTGDGFDKLSQNTQDAIKKAMYETITQKITANVPNGEPQDLSRNVTLSRNVDYDYKTSQVSGPDWKTITGTLPERTVPAVAGYVPSRTSIPAQAVDGSQVDTNGQYIGGPITITYIPSTDAHYKTYKFVDDDNNGAQVPGNEGEVTVNGQVGKAFDPASQGLKVPDNYKLANGQALPTSITMTVNDPLDASKAAPVTIHVVHAVLPGETQTKTVTRNIYETAPGSTQKQLVKKQTVTFTKTDQIDQVTKKVKTAGQWIAQDDKDSWDAVTVSKLDNDNYQMMIDGKASEDGKIAAVKVTPDTKDVDVNITFNPVEAQTVITFVDNATDNPQAKTGTIGNKTITGNKGDKKNFDFGWLPDGYIEDKAHAKDVPASVELGKNYTVYVEDGIVKVSHSDPQKEGTSVPGVNNSTFPKGVDHDDLNKPATRTITVKTPDGKTKTINQSVPMHRDATVDPVNGKVTYGDWTPDKDGDQFPAVNVGKGDNDIPAVDGYKPDVKEDGKDLGNQGLPAEKPTDPTKPHDVDVTYMPDKKPNTPVEKGSRGINFTDPDGKPVGKGGEVTGDQGTDVPIKGEDGKIPGLPSGWVPAKNAPTTVRIPKAGEDSSPVTIPVEHGKAVVSHTDPKNPTDTIPGTDLKYPKGVGQDDLNGTQERIINITKPDGTRSTVDQKVPVYRDATVDEVTGSVTYTDWTPVKDGDGFKAVDVPEIKDGYKTYQGAVKVNGQDQVLTDNAYPAGKVNPKGDNKPQTVDIHYVLTKDETPGVTQGSRGINFTDPDGKTVATGKISGSEGTDAPIKGEDGKIPGLPSGWVPAKNAPTTVHIPKPGEDSSPVTIPVEHGKAVVSHTDPKNPTDTIPGTDLKYPKGVGQDDLNGTQERIINITKPDGTKSTVDQKVPVYRDATVDEVTGSVTYTDWTQVKDGDGFKAVDVPEITTKDGKHYQASVDLDGKQQILSDGKYPAASVDPKGDNKSQTVDIKYVLTSTDPVKPTQDQIVVSHDQRDGQKDKDGNPYVIQKGEKLPGSDTISDTTLIDKDLNRSITRTVTLDLPDGTTKTMTQRTLAHRDAIFDGKTGKFVKFTPWKAEDDQFNAIKLDPVDGYTAHVMNDQNQDLGQNVPATKIDPNDANGGNQALTVKYTKNAVATPNKPSVPTDTGFGGGSYTGSFDSGAPSATPAEPNKPADNSNDDLQKQIDELKKRVDKLANKVDKLAQRKVAAKSDNSDKRSNGHAGQAVTNNGYGVTNGGYGINTGNGTSYVVNNGGYSVMPSGYVTEGYGNGAVQAAAIDQAAANRYGNELPQTGSENQTAIVMAGIMSLAVAAAAAIGTRKRKED